VLLTPSWIFQKLGSDLLSTNSVPELCSVLFKISWLMRPNEKEASGFGLGDVSPDDKLRTWTWERNAFMCEQKLLVFIW